MRRLDSDTAKIWDKRWRGCDLADFVDIDKTSDLWTIFHRKILKREIASLASRSHFLEAGCGMGQWCFYAAKLGHLAVGVDVAEETITRLNQFINGKQEYRNITFLADDLRNSKLESDKFDLIVSLGVIEHFPDPMPMLRELYRVLKPGGRIFISVPNIFAMQTITRPLAKLLGIWRIGYEKSYSPGGLTAVADKAGFKIKQRGILPSGQFFGRVLNSMPIVGAGIESFAFFLENHQRVFGLYLYLIAGK